MHLPKRPRDPIARTKLVMDMLTGERPNDKEQALAALLGEPDPEPTGPAKAAKARAASQPAARRSEVARKAAAARWGKAQA